MSKKQGDAICERLWIASGSLKGLAALFTQGTRDPCFDGDDLYGIGQLLGKIGEEFSVLEDLLRSGADSMASRCSGIEGGNENAKDEEIDFSKRGFTELLEKAVPLIKKVIEKNKNEE